MNKTAKHVPSNKKAKGQNTASALFAEATLTSKCTTHQCKFLVDTGAPGVYISGPLSRILYGTKFPPPGVERSLCTVANSQEVELLVGNDTLLSVQDRSLTVRPLVLEDLSFDGILGYNALHAFGFMIDPVNHCLTPGTKEPLATSLPDTQSGLSVSAIQSVDIGILTADATVEIPGRSARFVPSLLKGDSRVNDFVLIERPSENFPTGLLLPTATASVENSRTNVFLLNATDSPVIVHRHLPLAAISRIDHCPIIQICALKPESPIKLDRQEFLAKFPEPPTLDPMQKKKLQDFLWAERAVFSKNEFDIGKVPHIEHRIDTGDERPYKETLRRHSPKTREDLKTLVDEMLSQGIIRESFSPWSSAPVLVRKKNGGLRFAVDYRGLNSKTIKDSYPLPQISDALDSLSGAKYFSALDVTQAFWTIPLTEDSMPKTAFTVPQGLYEFVRMPFGLVNAPATFQRAMQSCLTGLNWEIALCFLDDIIVFSKSFDEHLERLKTVFGRLVRFNLKLKPSKCEFLKQHVKYLGHVVSAEGISTDPAKIKAIQEWESPKTATQVRSFLGLAQYYRRFVKGFSQIAAPLHEAIIHGQKKIKWGTIQEDAFRALKKALSEPPIMAHPDFSKPFTIDVDASDVGIGAVLSQLHDDSKERVVAYQSYKFKAAERKWSTTEREFFGLVMACRLFKSYVYGRRFTVRTDHQALLGIINKPKDLSPKWARWWSALSGHNCKIIYRPGKNHGNADGLSRTTQFEDVCIDLTKENDSLNAIIPTPAEPALLKDIQAADPVVSQIIKCLKMQFPNRNLSQYLDDSDPYHAAFISRHKRFSIRGGLLQYDDRTVVPRTALPSLLGTLHDAPISGHLGRKKTLGVIKERFWWPHLTDDVRRYVQSCLPCQARKGATNRIWAPCHPSEPCDRPWERVAMDIATLPTSHGCSYVLVVVDYFSKWVEAFPLRSKEASVVARILLDQIFYRHGTPTFLHSDRGAEFTAKCLHELTRMCGIYQTHTPAYRPQADGLVERQIGTIKGMLAKFHYQYGDWYDYLGPVLLALRSTVTETTKFSPYEVLHGRKPRLPCDLNYGLPSSPQQLHASSYAELRRRLQNIYKKVKSELAANASRMKERYDSKRKVGVPKFKPGDWVWVDIPNLRSKMAPKWSGPYLITSNNMVGSLEIRRHGAFTKVTWDRCKLFHSRPEHLQSPSYAEDLRTATVDYMQDPPALRVGGSRSHGPTDLAVTPRLVERESAPVQVPGPIGPAVNPRPSLTVPPEPVVSGKVGTNNGEIVPLAQPASPPVVTPPAPETSPVGPTPRVESRMEALPIPSLPAPEIHTVEDPVPSAEPQTGAQPVPPPSMQPTVVLTRLEDLPASQQMPVAPPVCPEANASPAPEVPAPNPSSSSVTSGVLPASTAWRSDHPITSGVPAAPPMRRSTRTRAEPQRLGYGQNFRQIAAIKENSPVGEDVVYFPSGTPLCNIGLTVVDSFRGPVVADVRWGAAAWQRGLAPIGAIVTKVDNIPVYYAYEYYNALRVQEGMGARISYVFE